MTRTHRYALMFVNARRETPLLADDKQAIVDELGRLAGVPEHAVQAQGLLDAIALVRTMETWPEPTR